MCVYGGAIGMCFLGYVIEIETAALNLFTTHGSAAVPCCTLNRVLMALQRSHRHGKFNTALSKDYEAFM